MKKLMLIIALFATLLVTACTGNTGSTRVDAKDTTATLKAYDDFGNLVDEITSKNIELSTEPGKFPETWNSRERGNHYASVISASIDGSPAVWTGTSVILEEEGITDILKDFNANDKDPITNQIAAKAPDGETLLVIKGQNGKILAAYAGDVSFLEAGISKGTAFAVNGYNVLAYRCEYSLYDMNVFQ